MAGMGFFLLMDINCSFRCAVSGAGQQADAVGFHSRNGHPFACHLLLERRTDRTAMEQWGWQLTTQGQSHLDHNYMPLSMRSSADKTDRRKIILSQANPEDNGQRADLQLSSISGKSTPV